MPARPALVILAAGLGRRFGGLKQLAPVGPGGEAIMDYSARDALAAGFQRLIVVVRSEVAAEITAHVGERWPGDAEVTFVSQDRDELALEASARGRSLPLGTTHAVLVALEHAEVDGPVGVVNADDLYGAEPFAALSGHFAGPHAAGTVLVAYELRNTLLGDGAVNRALCDIDDDGRLQGIEEGRVSRAGDGFEWVGRSGRTVALRGDEPVSMNCWGFPAGVAPVLRGAVERFVGSEHVATEQEVLLPDIVHRELSRPPWPPVRALRTGARCIGVTHAADLEVVRGLVREPAW